MNYKPSCFFIKHSDFMVCVLFKTSQTTYLDRLDLVYVNQATVDLVRQMAVI